jgi:CDP-glucose 4,6-dehydratase
MILDSNILITGATGFIGAHLVEKLINNNKSPVYALDINNNPRSYFFQQKLDKGAKFIKADILRSKQVADVIKKYKIDTIFHLAAVTLVDEAYGNPYQTLNTNIMGTVNILEAARNTKSVKTIVVASSDKAYGKMVAGNRLPVTGKSNKKYKETDRLAGDHPYEVSKSSADLISQMYSKTYHLPVTVARFGNVYGEGDLNFSRLIPGIMKAILQKKVFEVRSNGKHIRDYIYVKDVVNGYLKLAEDINTTAGEAYNFGSDESYSVIELIKQIGQILKMNIPYKILDRTQNEIPYQHLDYSKVEKGLGWTPEKSLLGTIPDIYDWYKKYFTFISHPSSSMIHNS